jgi:hypothetical protein
MEAKDSAVQMWAAAGFSADELAILRRLIRTHERRLQELDATARTAAVVDAIYNDAAVDPALAAALRRAGKIAVRRKMGHASQN